MTPAVSCIRMMQQNIQSFSWNLKAILSSLSLSSRIQSRAKNACPKTICSLFLLHSTSCLCFSRCFFLLVLLSSFLDVNEDLYSDSASKTSAETFFVLLVSSPLPLLLLTFVWTERVPGSVHKTMKIETDNTFFCDTFGITMSNMDHFQFQSYVNFGQT